MYRLLTENYVLNANILVFMLIHTELFSNVSGLGLYIVASASKKFLGLVLTLIGVNSYWAQGLKPPTFMIMGLANMTSPPLL